jgi:hypothetical protein
MRKYRAGRAHGRSRRLDRWPTRRRPERCRPRSNRLWRRCPRGPHRSCDRSRACGRTDAGLPTRPPCSLIAAIVSRADMPGGTSFSMKTAIRSPSDVLTSSPTMIVSLRSRVAQPQRSLDSIVVGDGQVRQAARNGGPGHGLRSAVESKLALVWQCRSMKARTGSSVTSLGREGITAACRGTS